MKWRAPITLAVLVLILLGAAYYGWQTVLAPAESSSGSGPTTTTTPSTHRPTTPRTTQVCVRHKKWTKGEVVGASSFLVNVYNAGGVSGQAAEVLSALGARGFRTGVAANPPHHVKATNVSILTSTPNAPRVLLVKEQFKGPVQLVPGPELATGIDVIIGSEFVGMQSSAPTEYTLPKDTLVCTKFVTRTASKH